MTVIVFVEKQTHEFVWTFPDIAAFYKMERRNKGFLIDFRL